MQVLYSPILNLFCIHKRTFLVLCIVHIGTTHMHVYACFLLRAVFYTPSFHSAAIRLKYCCDHGLVKSQHGELAAFCWCLRLSSIATWWHLSFFISYLLKWHCHVASLLSLNQVPVQGLVLCFNGESVRQFYKLIWDSKSCFNRWFPKSCRAAINLLSSIIFITLIVKLSMI